MPPGGETFRFSPRFGENELRHGSHEWLPYSKDEVRLKSSNNNLSGKLAETDKHFEIFTISAFTTARTGTIMHSETVPGTVPGKTKEE